MPSLQQTLVTTLGGASYQAYLAGLGFSLIWPMSETSGTTILANNASYNGAYSNVTLANAQTPKGTFSPLFNGTTSYANLYTAALGTAFNFDEFTILLWVKTSTWTDGSGRVIARILRDANNLIDIRKATTNNTLTFLRTGNSTSKTFNVGSQSDTGFFSLILTASIAGGGLLGAGEMKAYKNGVQIGTTQTAIGASAGSGLSSTSSLLGSFSTTPAAVWSGNIGMCAMAFTPLTTAMLQAGNL